MSTRRDFVLSNAAVAAAAAQPTQRPAVPGRRDLLARAFPESKLASVLLPRERWKPFPKGAERAGWEKLPADARRAAVESGERQVGVEWPALPATLFLQYRRTGNRSNYERVRGARRDRLRDLVIAECVEYRGRFLDEILNGVWITCEETFWGVPAHLGAQRAGVGLPDVAEPIVDLFAAETASLLAWTLYLLGDELDKLSPLASPRIRLEIDRRMLAPNLEREDFGWMGLGRNAGRAVNNWNPWINSNWLTATLLVEGDEKRRLASVAKILRSLDAFLNSYHDDGGCDEGPGYWFRAGGSLFDCLELLHSASGGAIDFFGVPLVREIGRYIYRAHIQGEYFINFADASARLRAGGDLLFRNGRRIQDPKLEGFGAWAARQGGEAAPRGDSIGRYLPALFNLQTIRAARGIQPLVRDAWFAGIQVMAARVKEGSAEGLYLAAQGGHNAESHNHNDVGNFIVYCGGRPAVIDVGVETYTARTFSKQRYEIWTMQSAYHNLPTIDGVMQSAGREFEASEVSYRSDDRAAEMSLDIARAYPPEAGLESWKRTLRLDRVRNQVEIRDAYVLNRQASKITLTLMTPCQVEAGRRGEVTLKGPDYAVRVSFDPQVFQVSSEEVRLEDGRLRSAWGERLWRVLLTAAGPPLRADWVVRMEQTSPPVGG